MEKLGKSISDFMKNHIFVHILADVHQPRANADVRFDGVERSLTGLAEQLGSMKIPVDVLINMWTEMHDVDEEVAFATLVGLSHKNLLTLEEDPRLGSLYASYYDVFVTHHDVLRESKHKTAIADAETRVKPSKRMGKEQ